MTTPDELEQATEDTWARFVTAAAASIQAIEDTAAVGRPGERTRPWPRTPGADVPAGLWDALAAAADRREVAIVTSHRAVPHEAASTRAVVVLERSDLPRAHDPAAVLRLAQSLVLCSLPPPARSAGRRSGFAGMVAVTAGCIVAAACNVRTNPYRVVEGWDTDWRTTADGVELREVGAVAVRHAHALYAEITDPTTAPATPR